MTIDKSKLISAIESHLRNEYVGKSLNGRQNRTITDVRCEINEVDEYVEGGDCCISYRDFNVLFLVKSPNGKSTRWIDADIFY